MVNIAKVFKAGRGVRFCDINLNELEAGDWVWFDWVNYCEHHLCDHPRDFVYSMLNFKDLKPRKIIMVKHYDNQLQLMFDDIDMFYYREKYDHFTYMYKLINFN